MFYSKTENLSIEVLDLKRKRPNELSYLFCDDLNSLVKEPQPNTWLSNENAADRRKNNIKRFYGQGC